MEKYFFSIVLLSNKIITFAKTYYNCKKDEVKVLNMTYHSYWKVEENNFDVQPYCVKLFRQHWYMGSARTPLASQGDGRKD